MLVIYCDPSEDGWPENYMQLKAALDADCERRSPVGAQQIRATKNQEPSNQAGRPVTASPVPQPQGPRGRGQIAMRFGG